ncbi:transposase [Actinomadura sp. CNU-125]|uniref:RNA-guided endonuclease InsQ/TnpB family protein n=1 Tax=Actinomadura sp. CNU-125 TaxID=1904961 RepID=UPI00095CDB68|nr:RNA-guided endonuclease TnpB family protein [Actinomadura sp. CNU-125]OLT34025.1 transposase [Actinomadura sp. CNU-125]
MVTIVKVMVQVKLLPDAVQAAALKRTLPEINEAANWVSAVSFENLALKACVRDLRNLCYGELKARGFGAQAAQHIIKRVADAYTSLRAAIRAGNFGPNGSRSRRKVDSRPIMFRPHAAHTYDDRCLSWNYDRRTVSIWTLDGRVKNVRFACSSSALRQLADYRRGESDLLFRDGKWLLAATCEMPEARQYEPSGFIGVDRGITNLATTSDGHDHSGRRLGRYRRWQARKRAELQAKKTRSARQALKKRSRREARHAAHINHKIAKTVVAVAQRTERGIALEELGGIRERVTVPRDQRARLSSWPFHRLGAFIAYKAKRAGVPFIEVDPAHTSQRCPRCGHTGRANRRTRDHFSCRRCGLAGPADHVAAVNIAERAATAWVFVNMPQPAPT